MPSGFLFREDYELNRGDSVLSDRRTGTTPILDSAEKTAEMQMLAQGADYKTVPHT